MIKKLVTASTRCTTATVDNLHFANKEVNSRLFVLTVNKVVWTVNECGGAVSWWNSGSNEKLLGNVKVRLW